MSETTRLRLTLIACKLLTQSPAVWSRTTMKLCIPDRLYVLNLLGYPVSDGCLVQMG